MKTAKPSGRNGNRLPLGAHPGNTGGKKGRSGRPSKEYARHMRELLNDPLARREFEATLRDRTNRHFMEAWKHAARFGYGEPLKRVETGKPGAFTELVVRREGDDGPHPA